MEIKNTLTSKTSQDDSSIIRAIFTINCIKNTDQFKIKHVDTVKISNNEYISDALIEKYDIIPHVFGEIFQCNITDVYLVSTKKLPVMYVSVIYEKSIRRVLLFRIFLYVTLQQEVKSSEELFNSLLKGKYILEIHIDNAKKDLDDFIVTFPGQEKMVKKLIDFTKADTMKELIISLVEEVKQKISLQYAEELEYFKPPKNVISLKNLKF